MEFEKNQSGIWNYLEVVENRLFTKFLGELDSGDYFSCGQILDLMKALSFI